MGKLLVLISISLLWGLNLARAQVRKLERVEHPFAEQGLLRITKDKTYLYDTPTTPNTHMVAVRAWMYSPSYLYSENGNFEEIYRDSKKWPTLTVDYEWAFLKKFMWWSLKIGTGAYITSDKALFSSDQQRSLDDTLFVLFPHSASLVWRGRFYDKQIIVPYAEGGFDLFTFVEKVGSDSLFDSKYFWGLNYMAHYAVGGQLNLARLSRQAAINLDREYGINNLFLSIEYRQYIHMNTKFDFSHKGISGGLVFEM